MENSNEVYDVLVIGAGCAGLGAAMYSGRFGLKTIVLGEMPGGTITLTHIVENYPGFTSLSGQELADKLLAHVKDYDVPVKMERVEKIERDGKLFKVKSDSGEYKSKAVIYATGTEWRKLGVPGEKEFTNKGVHYCALCDGAFYKGKVIATSGSGDSAAKEGPLLAEYGKHVYMLVRGEKLKGEPRNNKRVENTKNLSVHTKVEVKEIIGDGKVTHLKLSRPIKRFDTGEETDMLPVDALFVMVGHVPKSELAKQAGVGINKKGEVEIDNMSKTNIPGFYAAGDVCNTVFKQAIIGVAEGVKAAYSAKQYIDSGEWN